MSRQLWIQLHRRESDDHSEGDAMNGNMTLREFVSLPTTVDFQALATDSFLRYAEQRPYISLGTRLENDYIVAYADEKYIPEIFQDLGGDFVLFTPHIMSPVDSQSNESSGITRVLGQPFLDLSGQGVVIGIVDTGIDYTLPTFRYEDGSTKLLRLWDQTLEGDSEEVYFGSVFEKEQINSALSSGEPFSFVPSRDEDGHGTFLASVAAGRSKDQLTGAAPGAELICVKVRRARNFYVRRFLLSPEDPMLFESTDFLLGVRFIIESARKLGRPAVICIGMGSNTSTHDGNSLFEDYISLASQRAGICFVTAAGNEANARHHTEGLIPEKGKDVISIKNGRQGASFGTLILCRGFDKVSVSLTSPTGEVVTRKGFRPGYEYSQKLILEDTVIHLRFSVDTGNVIWIGLEKATEGIWEINLYGDRIVDGSYHAWLPITGQADPTVEFLRPVPESTIVFPAAARRSVTCGAYSSFDGSLLVSSSWGPTLLPAPAPDIVAPGVRVGGYFPEGSGFMTGTSAAAAVCAGAAALLMQWGVTDGNLPLMNGDVIRSLLIGGAKREGTIDYPDNKWGYGKLDLYNTFNYIREGEQNG